MNVNRETIIGIIYQSIDEINEQLPEESWLRKDPEAAILGASGGLDSLSFINFVALIEEKCEAKFGVMLSLADSGGAEEKVNPFTTVASLSSFIEQLLTTRKGAA